MAGCPTLALRQLVKPWLGLGEAGRGSLVPLSGPVPLLEGLHSPTHLVRKSCFSEPKVSHLKELPGGQVVGGVC